MPHNREHVLATSRRAVRSTSSRRSRRRARPGTTGRACRGRSARRSCSGPPSCSPVRGATDQRRHHARTSRRPCTRRRSTRPCELIDFWRFNVQYMRAALRRAADLGARACGTGSSTGRSKGSSSRSRPFNFTSIGGNLPTAPGADGQHGALEAGLDRGAVRATTSCGCSRRPACRRRRDQLRPRHGAGGRRSGCSPPAISRASTSPARRRCSSGMWKTRRREHRAVPHLSAPRRRDRRQGLRLRAPVRRRRRAADGAWCAARSSTRARSARPRRAPTCRRACGRDVRERLADELPRIRVGDVARLPQLHGRGDRSRASFKTHARLSTRRRAAGARDRRRRRVRRQRRLLRPSDGDRAPTTRSFELLREEIFGPVLTMYVYDDARWTRRSSRATRRHRTP